MGLVKMDNGSIFPSLLWNIGIVAFFIGVVWNVYSIWGRPVGLTVAGFLLMLYGLLLGIAEIKGEDG